MRALSILGAILILGSARAAESPSADKPFIVHHFEVSPKSDDKAEVVVIDDFAFMILNESVDHPKMKALIINKKARRIVSALTWQEVEKALSEIPPKSEIVFYGRCLAPSYYGLPDDTFLSFLNLIEKNKLIFREESSRIVCTCRAK